MSALNLMLSANVGIGHALEGTSFIFVELQFY